MRNFFFRFIPILTSGYSGLFYSGLRFPSFVPQLCTGAILVAGRLRVFNMRLCNVPLGHRLQFPSGFARVQG